MLVLLLALHCQSPDEYSVEALRMRLRRLENENVVLTARAAALLHQLPNCTAFVQTGGCDPHGIFEQRRSCSDIIRTGSSGYCECREGSIRHRVLWITIL